ncbi:hypothetical protein L1987_25617 [Smallanthus sonchifolius]|uniref:Uncharacterized protein n=1 Tax=Smallanthus sonchifolius TaxID=185202 RepID=A0ACB9IA41_9ASTR|nr:hypothetical protein L1987_25617 [Smallanthus sonchifolius]
MLMESHSRSRLHHTYFSVSYISEVRVEGLETLDYLGNLQNRERYKEQGDAITFESELKLSEQLRLIAATEKQLMQFLWGLCEHRKQQIKRVHIIGKLEGQ